MPDFHSEEEWRIAYESGWPGRLKRRGSEWVSPECPLCGYRDLKDGDRFRINEKGAFCRQCCDDGKDTARFKELELAVFGDHHETTSPAPHKSNKSRHLPPESPNSPAPPAESRDHLSNDPTPEGYPSLLWGSCKPIQGTPGHAYLTNRRAWPPMGEGLPAVPDSVGWMDAAAYHGAPAGAVGLIVYRYISPAGETTAVGLEAVGPDNHRIPWWNGQKRIHRGTKTGSAFIVGNLRDATHVILVEGEPDALTAQWAYRDVVAVATGGAGAMKTAAETWLPTFLPDLPITIESNSDANGVGQVATRTTAALLHAAGRTVHFEYASLNSDLNSDTAKDFDDMAAKMDDDASAWLAVLSDSRTARTPGYNAVLAVLRDPRLALPQHSDEQKALIRAARESTQTDVPADDPLDSVLPEANRLAHSDPEKALALIEGTETRLPKVRTPAEMKETAMQTEWLVENLLPVDGLSLLVSQPKVGKSTIARDLAAALAKNRDWLGMTVRPGRVLHLALEERDSTIVDHYEKLGVLDTNRILIMTREDLPPPKERPAVLAQMVATHRPALVIIDTLHRWTNIEQGNDYAEVTTSLEPFLDLAHEGKVHIMILHHARKSGGEFGTDALGSTAYAGTADTVLSMVREGNHRSISAIGRDIDELNPQTIELDKNTGHVSITGSLKDANRREAEIQIQNHLLRCAPEAISTKEIWNGIGGRSATKEAALNQLVEAGFVIRKPAGQGFRYELATDPSF